MKQVQSVAMIVINAIGVAEDTVINAIKFEKASENESK